MKFLNPLKPLFTLLFVLGASELFLRYRYFFKKEKVSFRDKVVLITGGTRGLGLILARKFASEGAKIVILARSQEELLEAKKQIQKKGKEVLALKCDVSVNEQVKNTVAEVVNRLGSIDCLVNNAGIIQVGPVENMKREDFQSAMNVNGWGTFNMTMAVLPYMELKKCGQIINITSIGGKIAVPHLLPYVFSKFAMVGFSEGLQAEIEKKGIKVTTVIPGLMRTGSHVNAMFKGNYRWEYRWFSFLDSFPPVSIDPEKAASKIIEASRRGDPVLPITIPVHAALLFKALFPFLTAKLLSITNIFLPETTGSKGDTVKSGFKSKS